MKLVKRNKSKILKNPEKYIRLKKSKALLGLFVVFLFGFLLAKYEIYKKIKGTIAYDIHQSEKKVTNEVSKLVSIDKSRYKLYLNVKQSEMDKLYALRDKAIKEGHLYRSEDDYMKAKLKLNNEKSVPIEFRLKGDHIDHLKGSKWSFRVKVKGSHSVLGMKKFSVQTPETRNHLHEWMYHTMLKFEGLISLRYYFVRVFINGIDKGIFALEEHFDKRLIEHNQLKDGPIIKFSEVTYWGEIKNHKLKADYLELLQKAEILPFNEAKFPLNSSSAKLFEKALMQMEGFRNGKLKTSEVFNITEMAKYLAITDLTGGYHGSLWHNSRFYYNPITSLFSPVGYDATTNRYIKSIHGAMIGTNSRAEPFNDLLFKDPEFYKEYLIQLKRIGSIEYLNEFAKKFKDEIKLNEDIIQIDNPRYKFTLDKFQYNAKFIHDYTNPQGQPHVYIKNHTDKSALITVGNTYRLPIEIIGLKIGNSILKPNSDTFVYGKEQYKPTTYGDYEFQLSNKLSPDQKLTLQYRIAGMPEVNETEVRPWKHTGTSGFEKDFLRTPSNLSSYKFLKVDKEKKVITLKKGKWTLSSGLIIPRNHTLIVEAGAKLNMIKKGLIVSFSPVRLIGTSDEPILFYSEDNKGQGIVVYNAPSESVIRHTYFSGLSHPEQGDWKLTGAVTFYQSDVDISYSSFTNNSSEDSLNIVRSKFILDNSNFSNTFSDAFDSDFSTGKMDFITFSNIGNDSIDVSEAYIKIQNVKMEKISDKAVSGGEDSTLDIENLEVDGAELGVVSKDNTTINGKNLFFKNTKVSLCAFRKKEEFGPGIIKVNNFKNESFELESLIEKGSTLVLNGKVINGTRKDVKDVLYGIEYGKKTVR